MPGGGTAEGAGAAFVGRDRSTVPASKHFGAAPSKGGDTSLQALQGARLHTLPMRARMQGRGY